MGFSLEDAEGRSLRFNVFQWHALQAALERAGIMEPTTPYGLTFGAEQCVRMRAYLADELLPALEPGASVDGDGDHVTPTSRSSGWPNIREAIHGTFVRKNQAISREQVEDLVAFLDEATPPLAVY